MCGCVSVCHILSFCWLCSHSLRATLRPNELLICPELLEILTVLVVVVGVTVVVGVLTSS